MKLAKLMTVLGLVLACQLSPSVLSAVPKAQEQIQKYVEVHMNEHSRQTETIISSLAWDALPETIDGLHVQGGAISLIMEEPELYRNGKLKNAVWLESWKVEAGRKSYTVHLLAKVINGKSWISYLYTGDLFDSPELWNQKIQHAMSLLSQDEPKFFGKSTQHQELFIELSTISYNSRQDSAVQRLDFYCQGEKVSYRLINQSKRGEVNSVRFQRLES